jgi:hypothetical protein
MNYIKEYSTWNNKLEYPDETWVEKINWLHNFYDKSEFVLSNIESLKDTISDLFIPNSTYLQLGLSTGSSFQSFFIEETKLILNPLQSEEETASIIESHHGYLRFDETLQKARNESRSSQRYYPYYKIEGYFKVDKEIQKEVERSEHRYTKWIDVILSDLFPGWKVKGTQFSYRVSGGNMWIHLIDLTNNK